MTLEAALEPLTRQPDDPEKKWLTPARHRASVETVYADLDAAQQGVADALEALNSAIAAASEAAARATEVAEAALPMTGGTITGDLTVGSEPNTPFTLSAVGQRNVLLNSGSPHLTGGNNVGIGLLALLAANNASGNVACGNSALGALVTGSRNVAVGRQAMALTDGANSTTAIGMFALEQASGSTGIVGVGFQAGQYAGRAKNPIIIGSIAGRAMVTISTNGNQHDLSTTPLTPGRVYVATGTEVTVTRSDGSTMTGSHVAFIATGTETSIVATSGLSLQVAEKIGDNAIMIGPEALATANDAIALGRGVRADDAAVVKIGRAGVAQELQIGANKMVSVPDLKALISSASDFDDLKTKAASL